MPAYVIAFDSTHAAMAADDALRDVPRTMIPTPRQITVSCGMALRLEAEDDGSAFALLEIADPSGRIAHLYREIASDDGLSRNTGYVSF